MKTNPFRFALAFSLLFVACVALSATSIFNSSLDTLDQDTTEIVMKAQINTESSAVGVVVADKMLPVSAGEVSLDVPRRSLSPPTSAEGISNVYLSEDDTGYRYSSAYSLRCLTNETKDIANILTKNSLYSLVNDVGKHREGVLYIATELLDTNKGWGHIDPGRLDTNKAWAHIDPGREA